MDEEIEILSVKQAADMLGVSERTILRLIKEGKIISYGRKGSIHAIPREQFFEYLLEYEQSRKVFLKPGPKPKEDV